MNQLYRYLLSALLLAATATGAAAADTSYTIAVIPKGTTHIYWKSVHAGAVKAQQELEAKGIKVDLIWKGPLREDDRDQQIQVVENFMTRRVNGMVLAPLDSQALVNPVVNAAKSKIPIVIIDSALKTDKYVSFVATDNYKGGQLAGQKMGELLGGKGNVIMLRYAVGSASTEEREQGFLDVLKEKFPNIKVISSDQHAGATRESAYQASQNLLNRFARETDGAYAPNEPSFSGLLKALKDIGKAGGKIKAVGFDASETSEADIKNGDVQGLVLQDPMRMGYLGVLTLVNSIQGQTVEKHVDTGVQLITPENYLDPAMHDLLHPPFSKYLKD